MQDAIEKANVLVEALPYIKNYYDKVVVVKVGGSVMDDERALTDMLTPGTSLRLLAPPAPRARPR